MISRLSAGWQTTLADLALILFMVAAAGLHAQRQQPPAKPDPAPVARGEPLALYRAYEGAPPLGEWLAEQAPDGRQYLTIVARYEEGEVAAAADEALALARQAGAAGASARIVLEPGHGEALATLAFDRPSFAVAQTLQSKPQD